MVVSWLFGPLGNKAEGSVQNPPKDEAARLGWWIYLSILSAQQGRGRHVGPATGAVTATTNAFIHSSRQAMHVSIM